MIKKIRTSVLDSRFILHQRNKKSLLVALFSLFTIAVSVPIIRQLDFNQPANASTPQEFKIYPNSGSTLGGDKVIIRRVNQDNNFQHDYSPSFIEVSVGAHHSCAIASNNKAYCWGQGDGGRLGNNSFTNKLTPSQVSQGALPASAYFTQISAGGEHTCALASNNKAYCWGRGDSGEIGNNNSLNRLMPTEVHQTGPLASIHFTQISAGASHTCALASNNKVYCWGRNNFGQLGDNSNTNKQVPTEVVQGNLPSTARFNKISAGASHTCALASNNKVYCWGRGDSGQLGNNSSSHISSPKIVHQGDLPTSSYFVQLATGGEHTCALSSNDNLHCWGRNNFGQLGNNSNTTRLIPSLVSRGELLTSSHFVNITAGDNHTCAMDSGDKTYCWGKNNFGQLGDNSNVNRLVPTMVKQGNLPVSEYFTQLVIGGDHACTVASNNKAYCWGHGIYGQLGNNSNTNKPLPTEILPGDLPTTYTPGTKILLASQELPIRYIDQHQIEITMPAHAEGKVNLIIKNPGEPEINLVNAYHYFDSANSQPSITNLEPTAINSTSSGASVTLTGNNFSIFKNRNISTGDVFSCAITATNQTFCWGDGSTGQLGDSINSNFYNPVKGAKGEIPDAVHLTQMVVGEHLTCGLGSDHKAYCWGAGRSGQLGNSAKENSLLPVQVHQGELPTSAHFTYISSSYTFVCALASNNKAYCWGNGYNGNLGNGDTSGRSAPVQVKMTKLPPSAYFTQISIGSSHACAIASNNKTYCWGSNSLGQAGTGTIGGNITIPTEVAQGSVPPSAYFTQISSHGQFNCALASNNKAYCWGRNSNSQLGNNTTTNSATPVEVLQGELPLSAHFTQISTGYDHVCAIASNNKTYCWGKGEHGRLGSGNNSNSKIPKEVKQDSLPASTYFTYVSAGASHTCALASNNKVYCWGYGVQGRLGHGLQTNALIPVQILQGDLPTAQHFTKISAGPYNTCAIGSDNANYCWGANDMGQLATGGTNRVKHPIKIAQGEMPNSTYFRQIATSNASFTCGVASDNKTYCWGSNNSGQLGNGHIGYNSLTPSRVVQGELPDTAHLTQISTRASHVCALASNHRIYCWGANHSGQLGNGKNGGAFNSATPVQVLHGQLPASARFTQVDNGNSHTCALASNNKAYCWGSGVNGKLGNGMAANHNKPVEVKSGLNMPASARYVQISVGDDHACALASDGKIYCWGVGSDGALGTNSTANSSTPVAVSQGDLPASAHYVKVSAGRSYTCALASNNKAYCWGRNNRGQLGNGTKTSQRIPRLVQQGNVPTDAVLTTIATGGEHTCAIDSNYKDYCWGKNDQSQLGTNNNTNFIVPTKTIDDNLLIKIGNYQLETIATSNTTATFIAPRSVLAIPEAPHIGPAPVSLTRLTDRAAAPMNLDLIYFTKPNAPTNLIVTPNSLGHSVKLSFNSPSTNGNDALADIGNGYGQVTDYKIQYCLANADNTGCQNPANSSPTTTNPTNWVSFAHPPIISTTNQPLEISIPNLNHTSFYLFRVAATNQAGDSNFVQGLANLASYISLNLNQPNLSLILVPTANGSYSSARLETTTNTNLAAGYQLRLSTNSPTNNSLNHTVQSGQHIGPVSSNFPIPLPLQPNTWGFYIPNTTQNSQQNVITYNQFSNNDLPQTVQNIPNLNHSPVPSKNNPLVIAEYNQAVVDKKLSILFGASVNLTPAPGTYRQTVVLEVVGK